MTDNNSESSFPIVAIGASAGGLNALNCFIGALPREFSFAVVFMQHLSAKHRSLLPEILHNRRPDIGIIEIADGMRVLPGKVFLCPPGKEVRVRDDAFNVMPIAEDHFHLPIDEFFASLAEYAGDRSIAVIFSGAGTDGARGIQAIRNAGGSVFVQDPETAEFPGMPAAAISTDRADRVLPPEEIAREILKLHQAPTSALDDEIAFPQFETFSLLIQEKTGQSFAHYKKNVLGRRIKRRMYLRGISSVEDYLRLMSESASEAAGLAADLMIGVTSFYRDRLAWKALKTSVAKRLAAEDKDTPVRVWTPACATGEEPYSIAMMLRHEFGLAGRKREIQVFATDVNDSALERAREGRYPGSIAADVPPDYMKQFFTCSEDGLSVIISKEVRESVVFARQNLLTDPPFSRLDLVICRNLLIYLEPEAQEKCISLFHYALMDGGYLFLGNAESPGRKSLLFKSLSHKKCRIYRKIESAQPARLGMTVPFASERAAPAHSRVSTEPGQTVAESVQQALLDESGLTAVAINENYDIVYNSGPIHRYLRQPRGEPTQNLLELLPKGVKGRIRGALYRAGQEAKPVTLRATIPDDDLRRQVILRISRVKENLFLVIFSQRGGKAAAVLSEPEVVSAAAAAEEDAVRQLENELAATRADLQSTIEQLRSLNEEMQAANEELQAANEELETSREELQSLNEELITVNSQLQSKIEEQEETNDDLNNFLASTNIPTVFLDHQLRVRRYTPAMSRLVKLIPADVGRSISDMSQERLGPDFISDAEMVLENLSPARRELKIGEAWYVRTALPYRTSDNRIEGVVITYSDVSDLKEAEERTRHLASFPQLNPNPVIEVDLSGKITFSNPATEKILEGLGMDRDDATVFLPVDIMEILRELLKREESVFYREVILKNRVFGETVYLSAQFDVVRIYGYEITEVKKADEIRSRLAAIVESADDAIISKDLKGVITTWNIGAERLFGYTAEEAIGQGISFLVPPGHEDDTAALLSRIAEGEHIERFETLRMHKSGAVIPVSLTFSPIKDSNGRVVGASKIAHDISERRHAEEAIRQSEEQFRTLADSIPNLAWWANGDGYITWYNRRWYEYTGTSPEQMEGWGWQMVHDPAVLPEVMERWKMSISTREPFEMEFPLRGADGVFRPFLTRILPLKDSEGRVLRWFGTNTDISALKEAEKEMRRSELRYRSYVEVTNQWAWVTAPDGMVVEDIPALRNFTGQTYEEAKGVGWADTLHPEDLECTLAVWKRAVAAKTPYETEYRMRRRDGVYRLLLARGVPIFDEQGDVVEWVGTCIDITERKQAEAELKRRVEELSEANEELRRFTQASAGRELRMIEMKKEINELCARAGLPRRYSLDFETNLTEGSE